jgi:hypothetical protein
MKFRIIALLAICHSATSTVAVDLENDDKTNRILRWWHGSSPEMGGQDNSHGSHQNGGAAQNGTGNNFGIGSGEQHQALIQQLIKNRHLIHRDMVLLDNGVQAWTWSDDPTVDGWIQQHVAQMMERINTGQVIRQRDPLFVAIFENADLIEFDDNSQEKAKGVSITETASDQCAIDLIHTHAQTIDNFIKLGRAEVRRNHAVPASCRP